MKLTISTDYKLGSLVYLQTDPGQYQRQVIAIKVNINMSVEYLLACATEEPTWHYSGEMTVDRNVLLDPPDEE